MRQGQSQIHDIVQYALKSGVIVTTELITLEARSKWQIRAMVHGSVLLLLPVLLLKANWTRELLID